MVLIGKMIESMSLRPRRPRYWATATLKNLSDCWLKIRLDIDVHDDGSLGQHISLAMHVYHKSSGSGKGRLSKFVRSFGPSLRLQGAARRQ